MIVHKLKKVLYVLFFVLLIITNVVSLLKLKSYEYSYQYYFADESDEIFDKLKDGMNGFTDENKFIFIYRSMRTDGGGFLSSIVGITKDRKLYITYGNQPMYLKGYGEKHKHMIPEYSVVKKLSNSEYSSLMDQIENACVEYEEKSVDSFLANYPTDWKLETLLFYNNKCYSYDPQILSENDFFSKSYSEKDENFKKLELSNIRLLHDRMSNIKKETSH